MTPGRKVCGETFAGSPNATVPPDKRSVFSEVHRVLTPGSVFCVYEQVRRGEGDLTYPLPWADDERSSFVEPLEVYVHGLEAAGFGEVEVEDRTGAILGGPLPTGHLTPAAIFGPMFAQAVGIHRTASEAGQLASVSVLAQA